MKQEKRLGDRLNFESLTHCVCGEYNIKMMADRIIVADGITHTDNFCGPVGQQPSYSDAQTLDGGSPTPGVEDVASGRKELCVEARCERTYSVVVPSTVPHLSLVPGGWWVNGRGLFWCPEHRCRSLSYREWSRSDDRGPEMSSFAGGGMREAVGDRARFELLVPRGVPFEEQFLTKFAVHMAKGAAKYADRNWEQFSDDEALQRAKSSAFRHFMQWLTGTNDGEDHASAVVFNLMAAEHVAAKLERADAEMTANCEAPDCDGGC